MSDVVVRKRKKKVKVFPIVNAIIFIILSLAIMVPLWKVIVDSLDATAGYGMNLWPQKFTLKGYKEIVTKSSLYRPFLISVFVTVCGSLLGLTLSTLGAYVLIQFEMPGRNFLANMLLFTMIFNGGMIPTYLVMMRLGLLNTLGSVIFPLAINVYNLVLMRNFFEGIPGSLFEAAQIDGCSPMGIFFRIVLPLSKAAIASIGLMFMVTFWNDYTNFKIYVTNNALFNFQIKLRNMVMDSDIPDDGGVPANTIKNAATIVAILPFMILYPILQDYFVQGVNVGVNFVATTRPSG
jgi:putative aldouronate transport system permease protein